MKLVVALAASQASVSAVKDTESYTWYEYTSGVPFGLERRGKNSTLKSGDLFGIRKSSSGKASRLITKTGGPTLVYTLDDIDIAYVLKRAKAAGKKAAAASNFAEASKALNAALKSAQPTAWTFNLGLVKKFRAIAKKLNAIASKDGDWSAAVLKVVPLFSAAPAKELAKSGRDKAAVAVAQDILTSSVTRLYKLALRDADPREADLDMVSLQLADAMDHLEAACAIYAHDGSTASSRKIEKLTRLDTASREEFSTKAWNWIQENARAGV